jgi:hypothetical protein
MCVCNVKAYSAEARAERADEPMEQAGMTEYVVKKVRCSIPYSISCSCTSVHFVVAE